MNFELINMVTVYLKNNNSKPRPSIVFIIWSSFIKHKILLFSLALLFITLPILYLVYKYQPKAEAGWWNETWMYRKAVNITNNSGSTLTDFQVSITLDTASLISAGKMQSDCDDIRITDVNGNVLPHWIEENNPGCNNAATKIWTKVPSIPTSGATVYVYYGNSSASNTENGDGVFEFFDDFNDGTLDTNKWTRGNPGTGSDSETSGKLIITSSGDWWNNSDTSRYVVSSFALGNSYIVESKVNNFQASNYGRFFGLRSGANTNAKMFALLGDSDGSHITNVYRETEGGSVGWYGENSGIAHPGVEKIAKFIVNGDTVTSYYNNSQTYSRTVTNWNLQYVAFTDTENAGSQFDYVFVRQYASTEPSASVDSEENKPNDIATPEGYWKFDEGNGTTVYDSSKNGHNGALGSGSSAPQWQPEDRCLAGKCLKFDGNDYVSVSNTINSVKSVSFWVKPTTNSQYFIDFDNGSHYIYASSGTVSAYGFSSPTIYVNGVANGTLNANQWNHILVTTDTGFSATALKFGQQGSNYLTGFLDEVKIYSYARSTNQVKADYVAGKSGAGLAKGAAVVMGTSKEKAGGINLNDGLVGYWKMDEASWNGTSGEVIDSSGNGNHGTAYNGANTTGGKFGNGGSFDGSNDYVRFSSSTGLPTSLSVTISFWAKPNTTSLSGIFDTYPNNVNAFRIYDPEGGIQLRSLGFGEGMAYQSFITANTYQNVTIIAKTSGTTTIIELYVNGIFKTSKSYTSIATIGFVNLTFGMINTTSTPYNGILDEVRIYNRALSPAEVRALYEWAPGPVAHFKLDDGSGTSAIDSSGFGRTGSIINALWNIGKFGKGLKMDGSGDYLEIGDF